MLYWHIGREILERQSRQGWGAKVIERLAVDLKAEFPDMKGWSRSNPLYMRAFANAWTEPGQIVQQIVGQLPWGHNVTLVDRLRGDRTARIWYARQAAENGWSRAILEHQIDVRAHESAGQAVERVIATKLVYG